MAKLNDPTGLTLTRNGSQLSLKWKNNDDYWTMFVKVIFRTGRSFPGWGSTRYWSIPYPTQDTSEWKYAFPFASFYPYKNTTCTGIAVGLQARNPNYASSNMPVAIFEIHTVPSSYISLSATPDSQDANKTNFTFGLKQNQTSNWIVVDLEYQSVLSKDSNTTDGSKIDWSRSDYGQSVINGTRSGADSYTVSVTDNFDWTGYYSATRWFRVRARGPAGASPWVYTRVVHALPAQANNTYGIATPNADGGGYLVTVSWYGKATPAHPIDYAVPEYSVVKPETAVSTKVIDGVTYKHVDLVEPTNPSWTQGIRVYLANGQVKIGQVMDRRLNADEAIVVRGTHYFNSQKTVSPSAYAQGGFGNLAVPSNITMSSIDPQTHRCTIGATNNSQVQNTFLAIYYRTDSDPEGNTCIGIIPYGSSSSVIVFPDVDEEENLSIGVQAFLADYAPISPAQSGVTIYSIANIIMKSASIVWTESAIPLPPKNIALTSPSDGTIRVSWDWSWVEATDAELSWADREDAWESTTEPNKYNVSNTNSGAWNIPNLAIGVWYVRVRLLKTDGNDTIYGGYSDTYKINLAGPPIKPSISLSDTVISETGVVTCYWDYISSDGTDQLQAEICESNVSDEGEITYGNVIGHTNVSRHLSIYAEDNEWHYGERHYLAVKLTSESGLESEWSIPEAVVIAEPIQSTITSSSFVERTETIEDVETTFYDLTSMPITIKAEGSGGAGTMTYIIERNKNYRVVRPDESDLDGYEGETVYTTTVLGEDQITIEQSDLIGFLDDGAEYRLIVIAKDGYGQVAETQLVFTVHWDHQAIIPDAMIETDPDKIEVYIIPFVPTTYILSKDTEVISGKVYYILDHDEYIIVDNPSGNPSEQEYYELYNSEGDTCDIYRLSADKPVLIVQNAEFGSKYVDPYPTLGNFGGHRIVYRTINGDYITANNRIAWKDITAQDGDIIDKFATIIDFNGEQLLLPYNLSFSNKWAKDFTETKYLGGSVQGDWNPSVSRTGSVKTTLVLSEDPDTLKKVRKLSSYPGLCHIRTPEGSSYSANITVTDDREQKWVNQLAQISLEITRVDDAGFDGYEYDDSNNDSD